MKFIWNLISKTNFDTINKARLFLLINTIYFASIGFIVWLMAGKSANILLFTVFPAFFIGTFGGMWYLYRYDI